MQNVVPLVLMCDPYHAELYVAILLCLSHRDLELPKLQMAPEERTHILSPVLYFMYSNRK